MTDIYSDDDEDLCPLCIEEMDISDKNFKPCPCGYQICQFCYNSIRNEMNGRCPACRRIYDDESVEYKQVTAEEIKRDHARQARREKERRQREKTSLPPQETSKKHLAGMRVIQKNLVYVIGLNPNIPTEDLHNILRADNFFGQFGKIQKIVINKRTNANGNMGLGVYVTFAKKDDAARCIQAVDGSLNDGKYLRAAYGTTKYCSSYLRGQQCPNPNCMFLHEPGEEADSYTRRDLSAMQHRNPPSVAPTGLPSLTQASAKEPQQTVVSAAPLPTASAWAKPRPVSATNGGGVSSGGGVASSGSGGATGGVSISAGSATSAFFSRPASAAPAPIASSTATGVSTRDPIKVALSALANTPTYSFSSPHITDVSNIPHYFAFNLSKDTRMAQYQSHWTWLSGIEASRVKKIQETQVFENATPVSPQLPSTPAQVQSPGGAAPSAAAAVSGDGAQAQSTPPPGLFGNMNPTTTQSTTNTSTGNNTSSRNSQELLAHLMKGKASSQKLNKQLNKYLEKESPVPSAVLEAVSERQPVRVEPPQLEEPEQLPPSRYIADDSFSGPIPRVNLVGDAEPSVWAGIQELTRLEKKSMEAQRNLSTAAKRVERAERALRA